MKLTEQVRQKIEARDNKRCAEIEAATQNDDDLGIRLLEHLEKETERDIEKLEEFEGLLTKFDIKQNG